MYLRNGGDAFSLQKLLGHADLAMTRRYCELAQSDVVTKHRQCSPGDRFLGAVRGAGGRKRLR
jgi:site-specific recombinase XerD